MKDVSGRDIKIAKSLRVIRDTLGSAARLEIDGELFPFATVDGFSVHPKRGQMPSVTVSIAAESVELLDSVTPPDVAEAP